PPPTEPYTRPLHDALRSGGVFGFTLLDRVDRRLFDMIRRIEIRLTDAESDNVLALGTQFCGTIGNGQGGGWLDALYAVGEIEFRSEEHTSELQSRENLVC